ncbi:MAG TPA: GNAT family protein [Anaerolineae bacterium]|nr:GNAT family protein [Anaerolineae bacterium]
MCAQHLRGDHVRLVALQSDSDIELLARWSAMSALWRLLDTATGRPMQPGSNEHAGFLIYPLVGDRPIGHAGLFGIDRRRGEAWLGIGLADHDRWDTPAGADALRVIVRYGFDELNLRRISLAVFEYNARALRAYESAGFAIEGRMLQEASRRGRSRAGVYMSLPREEWERQTEHASPAPRGQARNP